MRLGRYDNPYKCVSYAAIDPSVQREAVALEAADGGLSSGVLYTTGFQYEEAVSLPPSASVVGPAAPAVAWIRADR